MNRVMGTGRGFIRDASLVWLKLDDDMLLGWWLLWMLLLLLLIRCGLLIRYGLNRLLVQRLGCWQALGVICRIGGVLACVVWGWVL